MLVVIANDLPPAVRGRMKLWFIEPRPNVFVSGIKDAVAKKVVSYLHKHCPVASGLMIFQQMSETPGYKVTGMGENKKSLIELSGLQVIMEKQGLL